MYVLYYFIFLFCALWLVESGVQARGQAWISEVEDPNPGHWTTREHVILWNINWQESPKGIHLNTKTHAKASKLLLDTSIQQLTKLVS